MSDTVLLSSAEVAALQLFDTLPGADLDAIAQRCRVRQFEAGQHILHLRDTSSDLFFVLSGQVRVLLYSPSGRDVSFRDLHRGELFGELAAIDGGPRAASVIANADTRLAVMSRDDLFALTRAHPSVNEALLRHLVALIRRYSQRVYELSAMRVEERIRMQLLRLAWESSEDNVRATLDPAPTLSELANLVGTTREAVSREISRLSREGLVERQGKRLQVLDIKKLGDSVEGEIA